MYDIHDYDGKVQNALSNIQESEKISEDNKEDIREFLAYLRDKELSSSRKARYLQSAKQVMEYNDFRLKGASEDQVREMHRQIQKSAYYHKQYSPETKAEYKKFLRTYYKWENGGRDVPEKVSFLKLHVSESVKDRTNPQDLPKPHDIKLLCQNISSLRNKALALTHWELGSRIQETLNLKVGDYYERDGVKYLYVEGNKTSPNREARVILAPPALDRWLEEEHPAPDDDEAFLFCRWKAGKNINEKELPYKPISYQYFLRVLKGAKEEAGLECDVGTHTIRKARITFLKAEGVPGTSVDKRVGHVPGSDTTREYTRLSDKDSNSAYAQAYGEDAPEKEGDNDLMPLKCKKCGEINAGFRDRCVECTGMLEIQELEEVRDPYHKAKEMLWDLVQERGLTDEILEEIG